MRIRIVAMIVGLLASVQPAAAQYNLNPAVAAPFGRPSIAAYLPGGQGVDPLRNYNLGTLREFETRTPWMRPDVFGQYYLPRLEQPDVGAAQSDLIDRFIAERTPKLSPTGYPTGFMIVNPYFNTSSPGAYLPFEPRSPFNPYPGRTGR